MSMSVQGSHTKAKRLNGVMKGSASVFGNLRQRFVSVPMAWMYHRCSADDSMLSSGGARGDCCAVEFESTVSSREYA